MHHHFDFEGLDVLDLFSGTGNVAFEFISRDVGSLTAVDNNYPCIRFQKQTIDLLGIDNMQAIKADAFQFLKSTARKYHIIYADPPYEMDELASIPDLVIAGNLLHPEGWLILEHSPKKDFSQHAAYLQHRKYGHVNFSIFTA